MKTLTIKDIRQYKHLQKRQTTTVQKNSGLSLIVENERNQCKRFEGLIRHNKKLIHVPLGVFGNDIKTSKDLNNLLKTWDDIKDWVKTTGNYPKDYFKKDELLKSKFTLKELIDDYLDYYKQVVSSRTFVDRKRKFNQIMRFLGEDVSVTDLEWDRGGRSKVRTFIKSIKSRNKHNHSIRIRSLLNQMFQYGENNQLFTRGQNPCSEPFDFETVGYEPKHNPSIKWEEVPELFEKINSSNNSIITLSSLKLYLLTCIRVSVIVSMKWDWINEEKNVIVVPPDTEGLKRILNRKNNSEYEHYIPLTEEMKKILNLMKGITGNEEYVFWTPNCKKYPHQNPETINRFLNRLGYKDKLTGHGWRRVVVTSGQEIGGYERDIIQRQIGQTEHRSGSIGSYDKTQFLDKRRDFLEWWNKELVNQGLDI